MSDETRILGALGSAVGEQLREFKVDLEQAQASAVRDLRSRLEASNELTRVRTLYSCSTLENWAYAQGQNL